MPESVSFEYVLVFKFTYWTLHIMYKILYILYRYIWLCLEILWSDPSSPSACPSVCNNVLGKPFPTISVAECFYLWINSKEGCKYYRTCEPEPYSVSESGQNGPQKAWTIMNLCTVHCAVFFLKVSLTLRLSCFALLLVAFFHDQFCSFFLHEHLFQACVATQSHEAVLQWLSKYWCTS